MPIAEMMEKAVQLSAPCPSGCIVEFGVYRGDTLLAFRDLAKKYLPPNTEIYGFDSFAGMPKTSVAFDAGAHAGLGGGRLLKYQFEICAAQSPKRQIGKGRFLVAFVAVTFRH